MTKEEMARAYADGYNKEYQQIAYDAFLCGYEAKCESVVSEELEEAAEEHAGLNFDRQMEYKSFWNDVDTFIAGAEWMKEQMMKNAVEGEICGRVYDHINVSFADGVCKYLEPKNISHIPANVSKFKVGDKVRVIVIKED